MEDLKSKVQKVYFQSEKERDAANAAEAQHRGCDMNTTIYWWPYGNDEKGFYIIVNDD